MTLYRKNLKLSQEMFAVISCFEIALRNAIDTHYKGSLGDFWLADVASVGGSFDNIACRVAQCSIQDAIKNLQSSYTPHKLVAALGFGFWRYMFAQQQFKACGSSLLKIFPAKPKSTPSQQYNHIYVFKQLFVINNIRNRIAHHEPICFVPGLPIKDTGYALWHYQIMQELMCWMGIDIYALFYGLEHVKTICTDIEQL